MTTTPAKKNSPPATKATPKVVRLTEAQLRKFIKGQVSTIREDTSPVLQDYRKRLKLGYEPLQKARTMIGNIPEFAHQAEKLSQILSDLVTLFKETKVGPDVSENPTIPPPPPRAPGL